MSRGRPTLICGLGHACYVAVLVALTALLMEDARATSVVECRELDVSKLSQQIEHIANSTSDAQVRSSTRFITQQVHCAWKNNDALSSDAKFYIAVVLDLGSSAFEGSNHLLEEQKQILKTSKMLMRQAADEGHQFAQDWEELEKISEAEKVETND